MCIYMYIYIYIYIGLGTLSLRDFRVALRELGRAHGLFLFDSEVQKLYEEVDSENGIEVAELRYLVRRALHTIPEPLPYFQNSWNSADFCFLGIQFVALAAQASENTYVRPGTDRSTAQEIMVFARMIRLLNLVRVLWFFETFRDWLSVLPRSAAGMRDVFILAAFVLVLYAEMGVYLFGLEGRMLGKCVVSPDNPLANSSQQRLLDAHTLHFKPSRSLNATLKMFNSRNSTIGEILQPLRVCSKRTSALDAFYECEKGYSVCGCRISDKPGSNSTAAEIATFEKTKAGCLRFASGYIGRTDRQPSEALPAFGYMGFSNMGISMLTVFTLMTESNFSDLLGYITDANDAVSAWLFIVSVVVLSRFILVGLPIAIISNTWIDVARDRERKKQKIKQDAADDATLKHLKVQQNCIQTLNTLKSYTRHRRCLV